MSELLEAGYSLPDETVWLLEVVLRGGCLGCLTAVILTFFRRASAAIRHATWTLAAVSMAAMPALAPWTPATPAPIAITYGGGRPAVLAADAVAVGFGASGWLLWFCGAVSLVLCVRLLLGWAASRRLLAGAAEIRSDRVRERFEGACARLGIRGPVRLVEVEALWLPIAVGLLRPAVALPSAWRTWPAAKLDAVILHELAHIARRDMASAWAASIGRCVLWFNPLAWYAERRVRALAEQCCDEVAVRSGCAPTDYAQALIEIAGAASRSQRRLGWAAFAMARKPVVSGRVDRILHMDSRQGGLDRNRWLKAVALTAPLALLAASLAPAQSGAGVQGVVLDPSGARVPRARVILLDDSRVVATALTSGSGEFKVRADPGAYGIAVSAPGFSLFSQEQVVVTPEGGDNLEIQLRVESVEEQLVIGPVDLDSTPQRIRVGGAVQRTKLLRQVTPEYPADAKQDGVQGTVILDAVIGADGALLSLRVRENAVDSRLVEAALKAVRQWRYQPTLLNGQPVEVQTVMEINFTLAP